MYKYSKVLHIGAPLVETIFNEEVEITEKVDGCFEYTTRIMTDQGNIPIGKIVNQKLDVMVLSYNTDMKQAEYKRILVYQHIARTIQQYIPTRYIQMVNG